MLALVLEEKGRLALREMALERAMGADEVRIKVTRVGICGSDVHYYTHGRIGPFVVNAPMVLGHEAAGVVTEVGAKVRHLKPGDRVCMEPGIPDLASRAARLGMYNVDPSVRFWATPPVHGCLCPEVVHPAAFTYPLPDHVSDAEGALVEPFAVGMQAAMKARIRPGDLVAVSGAGPIGMMTALAALASGAARVLISDLARPKLDLIGAVPGITPVFLQDQSLADAASGASGGWGADVVFECSGAAPALRELPQVLCPGGTAVLVGMPPDPVPIDIVALQAREARIETVFRYANVYDRAIALIASGKVDLKPLVSAVYPFAQSIEAFNRAAEARPADIKLQIALP